MKNISTMTYGHCEKLSSNGKDQRRSAPRNGVSLAAMTELRGKPVRESVALLARSFQKELICEVFKKIFSTRLHLNDLELSSDLILYRAAWNLVSIFLIAHFKDIKIGRLNIQQSESWFRGKLQIPVPLMSEFISPECCREIEQILGKINLDQEFWDLLPYILDEHGPASRLSVLNNPSTAIAWAAKRKGGVFYTPPDVAYYMIEHVQKIYTGNPFEAKYLDPSCGTGVFLLAIINCLKQLSDNNDSFSLFDFAISNLYGIDISGHAVDSAAFVLLKECLEEVLERNISPWSAWHLLRLNFLEIDALCIDNSKIGKRFTNKSIYELYSKTRKELLESPSQYVHENQVAKAQSTEKASVGADLFSGPLLTLFDIFPQIDSGFDILVGNPPYAALGERLDLISFRDRFESSSCSKNMQNSNLVPFFIELMWQFTRPGRCAAAIVSPLSVAFNRNDQYRKCRKAMRWNGGRWQFAFFDREPHALFGEEVKTRNSILFRSENINLPTRGEKAQIETGPLRKWTSRIRQKLFQEIDFTQLDSIDISDGIPKLRGKLQAESFMMLNRRSDRLSSMVYRIGSCKPAEAFKEHGFPRLYIGGTAYNFLNVYRSLTLPLEKFKYPLSESTIHFWEFNKEEDARVAYSIISSRLIFWFWHVLGDGFHVSQWFIRQIPFCKGSISEEEYILLSMIGDQLWREVQNHRFESINGGKLTIGFRPLSCQEERDKIDTILIKTACISINFVNELRQFVQDNAVVDYSDKRIRQTQFSL
jgi:hypothetical protein